MKSLTNKKMKIERQSHLVDLWLFVLCLGTVLLTFIELGLADRKSGLLTGGFLASAIENKAEVGLLILTVSLANAAFTSVPLQMALWIGDRLKFSTPSTLSLSLFLGISPIIIVDMVWYQLARYFGDGFNFFVLMAIGSGSFSELLSQASIHLLLFGLGIFLSFGISYGFIRFFLRWFKLPIWPQGAQTRVTLTCGLVAGALLMVAGTAFKSERLNGEMRRFPASYAFREILNRVTDWDRDGSGIFSFPPDTALWNSKIYPYAVDIPGNGLDENGIYGDLPSETVLRESKFKEVPFFKRHPHFVLFVLESFRSDLIFRELDGKVVTPNLNRLAAEGEAAQWAFSHNGFTTGSLKALFLGNLFHHSGKESLFDDFKSNGYQTAIFSGQDESFGNIFNAAGMDRADYFYDAHHDTDRRGFMFATPSSLIVPGQVVLERLSDFLEKRKDDSMPLFLYVNLQDTHFPYNNYAIKPIIVESPLSRSEIRPENRRKVFETYLNAAANVDAIVGEIIARLEKNLKGEIAILVVGDHGESLFDDGFLGHGHHLTDIQMRVPLIVKGFPARIEEPIGQTEIRGMIQKALSIPPSKISQPERVVVSGKKVFQYLGDISHPSQISWVGKDERWTVDLYHVTERQDDGAWQKPGTIHDETFRELVHYWEAIQYSQLMFNK